MEIMAEDWVHLQLGMRLQIGILQQSYLSMGPSQGLFHF